MRTVESLLARGFDPNTRDEKGQPGLTLALREASPKVVRALLASRDIDVDALNPAGESALMIAALKGDRSGVEDLLAHGARVEQPGWNALHYAATGPDVQIVRLLVERGASVDAESPNGTTALMMAARYGSEASVDWLLKHGADPKRRNERNLGAADFARQAGRDALARRLAAPER